jgi:hypothetical protein
MKIDKPWQHDLRPEIDRLGAGPGGRSLGGRAGPGDASGGVDLEDAVGDVERAPIRQRADQTTAKAERRSIW